METEADDVGMQLLAKESAICCCCCLLLLLLLLAAAAAAAAGGSASHRRLQACIDPQAMVRVFQTFQQNSKKSESLLQQCVAVALRPSSLSRLSAPRCKHRSRPPMFV